VPIVLAAVAVWAGALWIGGPRRSRAGPRAHMPAQVPVG
jgi:hypothetical protein